MSIAHPSPRYQTESPLRNWQESSSSQPFLSPFRSQEYVDGPLKLPPRTQWAANPTAWVPPNPNLSNSIRDSGYGSSPTKPKPPPQAMHPEPETPQSSSTQSDTLLGHDDEAIVSGKPQRYASQLHQRRPSLYVATQIQSPEQVHPRPGEEYLTMRPPTPPASNRSLGSYIERFKRIASAIRSLPWTGKERCTADYFPGTASHSARHLQHRPMVVWHSRDYRGGNSAVFFDDSSVDQNSFYEDGGEDDGDANLRDEFDEPRHHEIRAAKPAPSRPIDLSREFSARPRPQQPRYPRGGYVSYEKQPVQLRWQAGVGGDRDPN